MWGGGRRGGGCAEVDVVDVDVSTNRKTNSGDPSNFLFFAVGLGREFALYVQQSTKDTHGDGQGQREHAKEYLLSIYNQRVQF